MIPGQVILGLSMADWLGLPEDWSQDGHHIDQLLVLVHWLILTVLIAFAAYFVLALVRFRAGAHPRAERKGPSSRWLWVVAGGIFAFEVILMAFFEIPLWVSREKLPAPEESTVVRVTGEQFAWNFHYPGEDGIFGATDPEYIDEINTLGLDYDDPASNDDLVTINQMHVPLGKPVLVLLGSKDVIHAFSIPVMRVKQDAIPGSRIALSFTPTRTGRTEIACAQLCGLGHYRMRAFLTVESEEEFAAWFEEELEYM